MRYGVISPHESAINSFPGNTRQEGDKTMRFLTQKQIEAMSWKDRKLYFLERYEADAKRWQDEKDDRKLFSVIYDKLVEAINSLPDNPNLTVIVAMNQYMAGEFETLDHIRKHFEGR